MNEAEFKDRLKGALNIGEYEFYEGLVETVHDDDTVDVQIDEELTIPGVKLRAASDGNKTGIICVPDKDSYVVFAKVRGQADYILIKTTGIDKLIFDITASIEGKCPKVVLNVDSVELKAKNVKIDSDATVFNGGSNMGLAKVQNIAQQLNAIEQDLTILKGVFTAWLPATGDMAEGLRTGVSTWAGTPLMPTQPAMLENKDVKH